MATTSSTFIYTGPWINWSHSAAIGATITLSSRGGAFLLSFLAFYVTLAGAQFWRILSFILHQQRAIKQIQLDDAIFHQHQVILRNGSAPFNVIWELLKVAFAWRNHAGKSWSRALLPATFAFLTMVLFALASIFSSEVTKAAGTDALIRGSTCGAWDFPVLNSTESEAWQSKVLSDTITAAGYARTCYGSNHSSLNCKVYVEDQIPWAVNQNATCPFSSGICYYSDTAALELDTGPLDSHDVFGLNTPKSQRITYRKVSTCAPIHTKDFARLENDTVYISGVPSQAQFVRYYYGSNGGGLATWTYEYPTHAILDGLGYQLTTYVANPGNFNAWNPIEQLNRTDADVSIFFLAQNSIQYNTPVDDPLFSAHIPRDVTVEGVDVPYYLGDYYTNVLACADQHQFCNPTCPGYVDNSTGCTNLTSFQGAIDELANLQLSSVQKLITLRFNNSLIFINMYYSVSGRGASALRASETVYDLAQDLLPNNQWMIEVKSWFGVMLARLQVAVVEYATGPTDLGPGGTVKSPGTIREKALCSSQKVHATNGYQNFSILGVSIIIVLGTLIIILGLVIDTVVGLCQKALGRGEYGRLAWTLDEKLQLQRMAYEGYGWNPWRECDKSVPIKQGDARLGRYANIARGHPAIVRV